MRKNTIARDPIGSTRNSLTRRDRRSLRRRILEVADEGLQMDTQRIVGRWFVCLCVCSCFLVRFRFRARVNICDRVAQLPSTHLLRMNVPNKCSCFFSRFHFLLFQIEYNPKLSEATPTTRVAYVKFMAHTMRRESNAEQANMDADESKGETSGDKKAHKSILRTTSKASAVRKIGGNFAFIVWTS